METFVLHNVERGTFLNVPENVREFQPVELQELQQGVEYQVGIGIGSFLGLTFRGGGNFCNLICNQ